MGSKIISRREFLSGAVVVAGATVIVACVPTVTPAPQANPTDASFPLAGTPQNTPVVKDLKILIAYDSVYGNTEKIAQAVIEGVGMQQDARILKAGQAELNDLEDIDLFIVGSPTHGGTFTEPVKNFLGAIPSQGLNGMQAAAFDTSFSKNTQGALVRIVIDIFGFAAPKIAAELSAKGASVVSAETFVVLDTEGPLQDGEVERAQKWASELIITASKS